MVKPADDQNTLYSQHIAVLHGRCAALMDTFDINALLIVAGNPFPGFVDDIDYPFRANRYFKYWIPPPYSPGSLLLIDAHDAKPKLYFYQTEDFWHDHPALPEYGWVEQVSVRPFNDAREIVDELPGRLAFIGPAGDLPVEVAAEIINPQPLLNGIDYHRGFKTVYEQACLRQANRIAVRGHRDAEQAYLVRCHRVMARSFQPTIL